MKKLFSKIILCLLVVGLISCKANYEKPKRYEAQIGDTPFNSNLDDPGFRFCDPQNVLHKRAQVRYIGGTKAFEEELISIYQPKPNYESFSGYFIIRFATNCKSETGRFRMEVHNENFELTNTPKGLDEYVLSLAKGMNGWQHAFYDGAARDCYKFINIKMINGEIEKS